MAARKDDFEKVLAAYKVLGLETGADDGEIKRAYRDMSRKTHPDKNPDDPKAGEKFDAVNKAYEALMDASLRAQFAQKLAAREAGRARVKEMDEARQKLRSQLEAREKAAAASAGAKGAVSGAAVAASSTQHAYEERVARLRREGRDLLAEEEYRRQRARLDEADRAARAAAAAYGPRDSGAPGGSTERAGDAAAAPAFNLAATVRLKWGDDVNEAAGSEMLPTGFPAAKPGASGPSAAPGHRMLSEEQIEGVVRPYGRALAVLSRKPTSACVVMHTAEAARALIAQPPAGFRAAPLVGEGARASAGTQAHERSGEGSVRPGAAPAGAAATTGVKRPRSAVPGLDSAGGASALDEDGSDRAEASGRAQTRVSGAAASGGIGAGAESFFAAAAVARRDGGGRSVHMHDGTGRQRATAAVDTGIGDEGVAVPTAAQNAVFDAREANVLARLQAFAGVAIG
jgi:curved DNA-binding protein CbpA